MPCVTSKRDSSGSGAPLMQPLEGRLVPVHVALLRRLLHHAPSCPAACFCRELQVLDHVLGRLRHHAARGRRSPCARAPGDLLEVAHARGSPVFSPSNLHSWVKSTVRIGMLTPTPSVSVPLIDLEQPLLRELLDQQPVLGQQARVVQPDAVAQEALEVLAVRACRSGASSSASRMRLLLLLACEKSTLIRFCACSAARALREVDQVDRRTARLDQLLDRLVQRRLAVLEVERHRALARCARRRPRGR